MEARRLFVGGDAIHHADPIMPILERLDPALDTLIPTPLELSTRAVGFEWTEGPIWLPSGRLLFADIPSNSIREYAPGAGVSMFMQPSGYKGSEPFGGYEPGSNGMTLDAKGRLTVAGHAQRNVWRLEQIDPDAPVTILADTYQGKRLNSPNDLVYKSDGSLYFTDPPYGLPTQSDELRVNGVYLVPAALQQEGGTPPARDSLQLLVEDLPRPNGLAFSPDEKFLYVANSEPEMFWMRYTVNPDGSLMDGKRFGDAGRYARNGAPDGVKVDQQGHLYCAGPGGVWVFSADCKHLGTIKMGPVANLAWGGDDYQTLYITAGASLYSIHLKVPGISPRSL
jgi:gluconolactonase